MQREYTLINSGAITLYVNHVPVPARGSAKVMLTLTRDQVSLFNMKSVDVVYTTPDGVRYVNDQCLEIDRPVFETSTDKSDALNRMHMINHAVIKTAEIDAKIAKSEKVKAPHVAPVVDTTPTMFAGGDSVPEPEKMVVDEIVTKTVVPEGPVTSGTVIGEVVSAKVDETVKAPEPTSIARAVLPPRNEHVTSLADIEHLKSAREVEIDAMPWTEFKKYVKGLGIINPNNALKRPALTALVLETEAKAKAKE